jgi:hypothetical protein
MKQQSASLLPENPAPAPQARTQSSKIFLVLFFKKEPLPCFPCHAP